jgi:hypothetical protein
MCADILLHTLIFSNHTKEGSKLSTRFVFFSFFAKCMDIEDSFLNIGLGIKNYS